MLTNAQKAETFTTDFQEFIESQISLFCLYNKRWKQKRRDEPASFLYLLSYL